MRFVRRTACVLLLFAQDSKKPSPRPKPQPKGSNRLAERSTDLAFHARCLGIKEHPIREPEAARNTLGKPGSLRMPQTCFCFLPGLSSREGQQNSLDFKQHKLHKTPHPFELSQDIGWSPTCVKLLPLLSHQAALRQSSASHLVNEPCPKYLGKCWVFFEICRKTKLFMVIASTFRIIPLKLSGCWGLGRMSFAWEDTTKPVDANWFPTGQIRP